MNPVVFQLYGASSAALIHCPFHGPGDPVGIENHGPFYISGRPPTGLYKRSFRTEKTFLVCVKNSHKRNFGEVKPLTQEVDSHQHINTAQSEFPYYVHSFKGFYIGVHVRNLYPQVGVVFAEILGHPLGQGRDKDPLLSFNSLVYQPKEVIHLVCCRSYNNFRI